jgi:hypothetical protein
LAEEEADEEEEELPYGVAQGCLPTCKLPRDECLCPLNRENRLTIRDYINAGYKPEWLLQRGVKAITIISLLDECNDELVSRAKKAEAEAAQWQSNANTAIDKIICQRQQLKEMREQLQQKEVPVQLLQDQLQPASQANQVDLLSPEQRRPASQANQVHPVPHCIRVLVEEGKHIHDAVLKAPASCKDPMRKF